MRAPIAPTPCLPPSGWIVVCGRGGLRGAISANQADDKSASFQGGGGLVKRAFNLLGRRGFSMWRGGGVGAVLNNDAQMAHWVALSEGYGDTDRAAAINQCGLTLSVDANYVDECLSFFVILE